MKSIELAYQVWDEFLKTWPLERLKNMTLDEYSQAGSKDTFTYWLESRLDNLGGIWGGSAFKFGVFSRKDTEPKENDNKVTYSNSHGWYTSFGTTAQDAFEKVRNNLVHIVELAGQGKLEQIESDTILGSVITWKIAFQYQDRSQPTVVNVFQKAPLQLYASITQYHTMASFQRAVMKIKPVDMDILTFGTDIWAQWSNKKLNIWKLSHGAEDFSEQELADYLKNDYCALSGDTKKKQAEHFKNAPIGTLFYLCHGNKNLLLIGQFISDAMPCPEYDDWLQRKYRVLKTAIKSGSYQGKNKGWAPNYRSTFMKVKECDLPNFEISILKNFFDTDLAELAMLSNQGNENMAQPISSIYNELKPEQVKSSHPIQPAFNRIYYGPPGTGKTYQLIQLLKEKYEPNKHASSVGEIKRQLIEEQAIKWVWWEAVAAALYELGNQPTKVPDLLSHPFIKAMIAKSSIQNVKARLWQTLQSHTLDESTTVNYKQHSSPAIFDKSTDSLWHLAGDWQELCTDLISFVDNLKKEQQTPGTIKRYSNVTFHQSYGYEEFIEGLRPVLNNDDNAGDIQYEIRGGVFKELCLRARQEPNHRFAMVIDEINRGNISKIFGELITLIETDKRDRLDGTPPPFEVTLPYSGEKFSVPANVDIIGAMNTADRSISPLDTALRRRFEFIECRPDTTQQKDPANPHSAPLAGLTVTKNGIIINICQMLQRINDRIEALYDREHCIGHAYFMALTNITDDNLRFTVLAEIFHQRIIPLLEEYFFDDLHKASLVLGDNQKTNPNYQFIRTHVDSDNGLDQLFGSEHGLELYNVKRQYRVQESALQEPNAYLGIYHSLAHNG